MLNVQPYLRLLRKEGQRKRDLVFCRIMSKVHHRKCCMKVSPYIHFTLFSYNMLLLSYIENYEKLYFAGSWPYSRCGPCWLFSLMYTMLENLTDDANAYCIVSSSLYVIKCSTFSFYLTNLYVTQSFAIASSVTYSEIIAKTFLPVHCTWA